METDMEKYEKPEMEVIIFDEEEKQILMDSDSTTSGHDLHKNLFPTTEQHF
jgi:hypothetical protein